MLQNYSRHKPKASFTKKVKELLKRIYSKGKEKKKISLVLFYFVNLTLKNGRLVGRLLRNPRILLIQINEMHEKITKKKQKCLH